MRFSSPLWSFLIFPFILLSTHYSSYTLYPLYFTHPSSLHPSIRRLQALFVRRFFSCQLKPRWKVTPLMLDPWPRLRVQHKACPDALEPHYSACSKPTRPSHGLLAGWLSTASLFFSRTGALKRHIVWVYPVNPHDHHEVNAPSTCPFIHTFHLQLAAKI